MSTTEEEQFNQRGQEMAQVESIYLDGDYDQELFVQRVQQYKAIIGLNIFNMGRALIVMKQNCQHGTFIPLLERMELTPSTAQKAMKVAAKFSSPKMQKLVHGFSDQKGLGTKLLALALESDDDLEILADGGSIAGLEFDDIDRMSPTEAKQALRKARLDAEKETESNDRLLKDKNHKADELAKKLAKAEGTPVLDRWPAQIAEFDQALGNYAQDAERVTVAVLQIVQSMGSELGEGIPDTALQALAAQSVNRVNRLQGLVGELQQTVFGVFSEFMEQPTYQVSDPLEMLDEGDEP